MADKVNPVSLVKEILTQKECPAAILISSPDQIRKARIANLILEKFLPQPADKARKRSSLTCKSYDCCDWDINKVKGLKNETCALSLFSPIRFFLLHNIDELKADAQKELLNVVKASPKESKLLLFAAQLNASSLTRKHFASTGNLVELPELKGPELQRWVTKELKTVGFIHFNDEVVDLVIAVAEENPDKVVKTVEHLALYMDSESLSASDISKVFSAQVAPGEYEFLDALTQKRVDRATILLDQLLKSGKNPFLLLSMLSRNFSNYAAMRFGISDGEPLERIREDMGVQPWLFNKQCKVAQSYSAEDLRLILEKLLRADSKLKNQSLGNAAIFEDILERFRPRSST